MKNKWLDAGIERMMKNPAYANSNFKIVKDMLPEKMSSSISIFK